MKLKNLKDFFWGNIHWRQFSGG